MPILLFSLAIAFAALSLLLFVQKRKNTAFWGLLFSICCISIAYWSRHQGSFEEKPTELVRIHGSKTVGRSLMPKLIEKYFEAKGYQIIEKEHQLDILRFRGRHPNKPKDLSIEIISKGSLFGFKQLEQDQCDLAMASLRIQNDLVEQMGWKFQLNKHEQTIAYDAVQLVVHPKLAQQLQTINSSHLSAILSGRIEKWGELKAGMKGNINCYLRDDQSGTFHYLEDLFLRSSNLRSDAVQLPYFEQIATAVAKDSFGLGFINYAIDERLLEDIKILNVKNQEGIEIQPSYPNILNGKYPLARPLYLYSSKLKDKNPSVQSILQFSKETEAGKIVHQEGLIPLAEAVL